jgi:hypothetical protein
MDMVDMNMNMETNTLTLSLISSSCRISSCLNSSHIPTSEAN